MKIRPALLLLPFFLASAIAFAAGPALNDKVTLTVRATVRASANWLGPTDKDMPRNDEKDEFTSQLEETVEYRIAEIIPDSRGGRWVLQKLSHRNRLSIQGAGATVIESNGMRNTADWTYSMPGECPGDSKSGIVAINAGKATVGVSQFFLCKVKASGSERYVAGWDYGAPSPRYETNSIDKDSTWALSAGKRLFDDFGKKSKKKDLIHTYSIEVQSVSVPIRGGSIQFTGSGSHDFEATDATGRKFAANMSVQYTILAGNLPPPRKEKPQVVLHPPRDHGKWLPRDGDRTSVTCAWKGEGATDVRFTLFDVSNEVGTCMNSPDKNTDPDLSIAEGRGFKVEKAGEKAWTATADASAGSPSVLEIASHDYAARGKVKCEVQFDHEWHAASAGSKGYLTIPLDENENGIADSWEEAERVKGGDPGDDRDKSRGNALDGDGFTVYEEYRGVLVDGKFTRLKPLVKELFIVNKFGPMADEGISLFATKAEIEVHRIRDDEYSKSRVVNYRKASIGRGGDQHGILLVEGDTREKAGTEGEGLTVPVAAGAVFTRSPGAVQQIIFRVGLGDFGPAAAAKDVAHELGHACGLKHHGDAAPYLSELPSYEKDGSGNLVLRDDEKGRRVRVFDAKGQEIARRPLTIEKWQMSAPARDAGPASGDVKCIMNYESVFSWSLKVEGGIILLANKPWTPPGNDFCTSPTGTGYNAAGNRPFSLFGDALPERSNCLSRIRLKDWDQAAP